MALTLERRLLIEPNTWNAITDKDGMNHAQCCGQTALRIGYSVLVVECRVLEDEGMVVVSILSLIAVQLCAKFLYIYSHVRSNYKRHF